MRANERAPADSGAQRYVFWKLTPNEIGTKRDALPAERVRGMHMCEGNKAISSLNAEMRALGIPDWKDRGAAREVKRNK